MRKERNTLCETNNLLGSVIYEPDNPNEQTLILTNLASSQTNEYSLEDGKNILHDGRRIPADNLLSETSAKELAGARLNGRITSFMLSPSELENAERLRLIPS